ncbi:hypothetical protein Z046_31030 [Pseudomonas aeruginosa VRFPA09]|nr:hypothetical protein Z046_31030 [Pseudomonas aeruginosa VRFPA09]
MLADIAEAGQVRRVALAEVGDPDLAAVEQAEHETLPRRVDQADHPGVPVLAGEAGGGNLGDQLQGAAVEHLDPARLVVGYRDQPTVLADRSADAVAALDQALVDALGQQVELGQAAVATTPGV